MQKQKSIFSIVLMVSVVALLWVSTTFITHADKNNDDENDDVEALIEGKGHFKFDRFPPGLAKKFDYRRAATLNINPNGKTLITAGEVTEVNWPDLKVKVWGLLLNVHVLPDALIIGQTGTGTTSNATTTVVGNQVDVLGDIATSTGIINARHFKNRSQTTQRIDDLQRRIQELLKEIDRLRASVKDLKKGI